MLFSTVPLGRRRHISATPWIFLYLLVIPSTIHAFSPNRVTTDAFQTNHPLVQQQEHNSHSHSNTDSNSNSNSNSNNNSNSNHNIHNVNLSRRSLWNSVAIVMLATPTRSTAATETIGPTMSIADAKDRFQAAKQDVIYLQDHFDAIIAQGGGDNVRRYLGTVGNTSAMYGIMKVLKRLQEEAADIVEYTESMNEFDYSLRAADTACYSANFVEFSAAKTKPKQFFEDALQETGRMLESLNVMAKELKL